MTDTLFLRFLAILLITNSHLDALYPANISFLGTGGAMGNSLFFMLSGLGLSLSALSKGTPDFMAWFGRRLARIYPTVWVILLGTYLVAGAFWGTWHIDNCFTEFVYPTDYWFIAAILLFYVILYPIFKFNLFRFLPGIILALLIPYFYVYFTVLDLSAFTVESDGYFKWIFYLQVFLFGAWMAGRYQRFAGPGKGDVFLWLATLLVYGALKIVVDRGYASELQFLIQWTAFPFVYYSLQLARHPFVEALFKRPVIGKLMTLLGTATLEIYLLQHPWYTSPIIQSLMFPFNMLGFWMTLIPLAWLVHRVMNPEDKPKGAIS